MTVPALGVSAKVLPVGAPNRVLDIPRDPRDVGWWQDGSFPGRGRGTVVLAVHRDSNEFGRGPFAASDDLDVGDGISVHRADGERFDYTINAVTTFRKTVLPYAELFDQGGPERVVLVTCGGSFSQEHGWDSNVVIIAERA